MSGFAGINGGTPRWVRRVIRDFFVTFGIPGMKLRNGERRNGEKMEVFKVVKFVKFIKL